MLSYQELNINKKNHTRIDIEIVFIALLIIIHIISDHFGAGKCILAKSLLVNGPLNVYGLL